MSEPAKHALLQLYMEARPFVSEKFPDDINYYENITPFEQWSADYFLNQYTWVILNSGMRYAVIKKKWPNIRWAYYEFDIEEILKSRHYTFLRAIQAYGYRGKMAAVIETAFDLQQTGWTTFAASVKAHPKETLIKLKYIGPVNVYHLMKNIGLDVYKPDRHILRLSEIYQMPPDDLFNLIQEATDDRIAVIDMVLWRWMEQEQKVPTPKEPGLDNFV